MSKTSFVTQFITQQNIKFNSSLYILAISGTYEELRSSVLQYESAVKADEKPNIKECNIYNSSKMHILSHLPSDIARFGSPILFEREKGKQFNKFIRECFFRINQQQNVGGCHGAVCGIYS
ncbi:hypothetical protein HMPREF1544_12105 [Mucor circinelloides 1006PhL]|uniref:Uncharacterized protein n=1 Tax=Mucor circinelloides f. circinelloides (strain 1006PhL) TaxID=1220926 RepID=S2JF80_MUCC1|nr:hypothetical protein HMPREF1544_12105 [Mucor circinelloides 1006PhL]